MTTNDNVAAAHPQYDKEISMGGTERLVLDYTLASATQVKNPDGTLPATVIGCKEVVGPGATAAGTFGKALSFSDGGSIQMRMPVGSLSKHRFAVRAVFRMTQPAPKVVASAPPALGTTQSIAVTRERRVLVDSTSVPWTLLVIDGPTPGTFALSASVENADVGRISVDTLGRAEVAPEVWHVAELIYDGDTLGVRLDGVVISVCAFSKGTLRDATGNDLRIGPFPGEIACVQISNGLAGALDTELDFQRSTPEWFLTYKQNCVRKSINLGNRVGSAQFDGTCSAWVQHLHHGLVMYSEKYGCAFEMHGAIWTAYQADSHLKERLGSLLSDEMLIDNGEGRCNLFEKGGIYWSAGTGAVAVVGRPYVSYQSASEIRNAIGLPKGPEVEVAGGTIQEFQFGRLYHRKGTPHAHEVHGAILAHYLQQGGHEHLGFPVTNEADVKKKPVVLGRYSQFEHGTIYWSSVTGAHSISGSIRDKYLAVGGPLGELGFPTSAEADIPKVSSPARYNTFQRGCITTINDRTIVCSPFRIFLGRVATEDAEGATMGQNDLYLYMTVTSNGHEVFRLRYPEAGDSDGHDIIEPKRKTSVFTPNDPGLWFTLKLDVWEADPGGGIENDHLGTYEKRLDISNAWGMLENNGIFDTGRFGAFGTGSDLAGSIIGMVKNVSWAVQPELTPNTPMDFWDSGNPGTDPLTYEQYGAAFRDIDPNPEPGDFTDWLDSLFYTMAVKHIAKGGNCFGMSSEAIRSWKGQSLFSRPLSRFTKTDWETLRTEFNPKQAYQVGHDAAYWFLGQFGIGATHDPKQVFVKSRSCFDRGDNAVMCLTLNADFTGKAHTVLPFHWDDSAMPWKVSIFDPNHKNEVQTMTVDPITNTFKYLDYTGGEWSGGRLTYMPWAVLRDRPRTLIAEVIAAVFLGPLGLFMSGSVKTESLSDDNGSNLDGCAVAPTKDLANRFVPYRGFDGAIGGEVLMRQSGGNFHHQISGTGDGPIDYVLRSRLHWQALQSPLKQAERLSLVSRNQGTAQNEFHVRGGQNKVVTYVSASKLGMGKDAIKITIENVVAKPGVGLSLNVAPGLGSIDVLTAESSPARITLEGIVNGQVIKKSYATSLGGGTRLVLSQALSTDVIKVGKIDNLRGQLRNAVMLNKI